jgi:hypothetical protein
MKHAELVDIGRSWLAKRCPVVITELSSMAGETPDVIGFEGRVHDIGYGTHLIECKISRADFRADAKKYYRRAPDKGMGDYRYFMAPRGLLKIEDIPGRWGLLEVTDAGRVHVVVVPLQQEADKRRETSLLISTLRRLHLHDGDHSSLRVKSYTMETKNTAVLAVCSSDKTIAAHPSSA